MKKLFNVKIKYDGIPIVNKDCHNTAELDDTMKTIRKKFGQ